MGSSKRRIVLVLSMIGIAVVAASGTFVWWAGRPLDAMPEAVAALESDHRVRVEAGEWLEFRPASGEPLTGVIHYPGGRIDPRAYAPLARRLAFEGRLVVIPDMPIHLAVLDVGAADEVIRAYPDIESWTIGGHSLGGAMASLYVSRNPTAVEGLYLWASYSPASAGLKDIPDLDVLSIQASEDGIVETNPAMRRRLPREARWFDIEGGNHAYFGWYGEQPGDGAATISREAQQEMIFEITSEFLRTVDRRTGR